MNRRLLFVVVLLTLGTGWGSTQALGKIAASSGHGIFGLIFWQGLIGVAVLGAVNLVRGDLVRGNLVRGNLVRGKRFWPTPAGLRFAGIIAIIGTVLPTYTFYSAVTHLPAGIMSILISTIPLLAFPMAMALGMDRFSPQRLFGLVCGLLGVGLIVLPGAALPDPAMAIWVPVALLGPLFYALEGNIVARWGTFGLDPVETMFWASLIAAGITLPLALLGGQMFTLLPIGRPEAALMISSGLHALLYAGYVWLNGRTGAVFAAQTSYFVTGSGVFWAMGLLGERFSPFVWTALAIMLAGVAMVRPRDKPQEG